MKYAIFMQINRVHTLEQLQYCSRGPRSDVEGVSLFATCIHLSTYERERYNISLPGLNYTTRTLWITQDFKTVCTNLYSKKSTLLTKLPFHSMELLKHCQTNKLKVQRGSKILTFTSALCNFEPIPSCISFFVWWLRLCLSFELSLFCDFDELLPSCFGSTSFGLPSWVNKTYRSWRQTEKISDTRAAPLLWDSSEFQICRREWLSSFLL